MKLVLRVLWSMENDLIIGILFRRFDIFGHVYGLKAKLADKTSRPINDFEKWSIKIKKP